MEFGRQSSKSALASHFTYMVLGYLFQAETQSDSCHPLVQKLMKLRRWRYTVWVLYPPRRPLLRQIWMVKIYLT